MTMLTPADIDGVIDDILIEEGSEFTDDPADRGGATRFGITQAKADQYQLGDVRDLTYVKAEQFYRLWFRATKVDQIPDPHTFHLVADAMVNHGSTGIRFLQFALDQTVDGVIGPHTLAAMQAGPNWEQAYARILGERLNFYANIVHFDPTQARFIRGWINRATAFLAPWPQWA